MMNTQRFFVKLAGAIIMRFVSVRRHLTNYLLFPAMDFHKVLILSKKDWR